MIERKKEIMTKKETIKAISEAINESQKRTEEILDAMQSVVFAEMANEGEIKLFDGVTFVGQHKDACIKRNPLTGADVQVEEKTVPKVKWGKACKDALNA